MTATVEYFERLVDSVSTPPVLEGPLAQILPYGPEDLPEMIQIVWDAEGICYRGLSKFVQRRGKEGWQSGNWDLSLVEFAQSAHAWVARAESLQEWRVYLEMQQKEWEQRCEAAPVG